MTTAADLADTTDTDARRPLRADSRRNRDAVVDALLELFHEGRLDPSSSEVAERAGISARSLFRYFVDVDDLCRAAIARQQARTRPLLAIAAAPGDPLAARISALVAQRTKLFETNEPVATVSRVRAPFQPLIATELARGRAYLRGQIEALFTPELARMGNARATATVAAADVLCSFEGYVLLRRDQGLSRAKATTALTGALGALFSSEAP